MQQGVKGIRETRLLIAGLGLLAAGLGGCSLGGGARPSRDAGSAVSDAGTELPRAVVARRLQEIGELERKRFAAMVAMDAAVLGEVLSEQLRYCHSDGHCETKAQFLEALGSGRMRYRAIDVLELEPRVVGTAMVVQGKLGLSVESQGKPAQFQLVFTDVYESTVTGWRMVAWQSTRLP